MSNIEPLRRRVDSLLAAVEDQQRNATSYGRVVIYDPSTGYALPGHEPLEGTATNIWIPDNSRDNYAKDVR